MKCLKILHVITSLKLGGAESALVNYLTHTRDNGAYKHYIAYIHDGPNRIKIERLGYPTHHVHGFLHTYDPGIIWKFYQLVQQIKPDVIHTALWSANMLGRIVGKWCGIPIISDMHGLPHHEGFLRNLGERVTMQWSDRIVTVAHGVKADYEKTILKHGKTADSRLVVIKNGIDYRKIRDKATEQALSRVDIGLSDDDFVIGAVGRLEPIKSYDVLIKAFAQALQMSTKKMKLCLIGDGSQMQRLKDLAHALGIGDHVLFLGFKSEAYGFYSLFDCFALSSQSEGLSIALLEAMAFGLPVITTHQGIMHDVITHGVHGYLIKPSDCGAYTHAILTLAHDQSIRASMACVNKTLIEDSFSLDSVIESYHALYHDVQSL